MVKPLFNRVIVLPIEREELLKSFLEIPASTEDSPRYGEIVAVGDDVRHCKTNTKIIWKNSGGDELFIGGVTYLIMNETDVLAIV
mgnify:CR=1 FL=1